MKHFIEKGHDVLIVTDNRGNNFVKKYSNFKSYLLQTDTPTSKNIFKKIISLFLILKSIISSIIILNKEKPNLVIGFGGYVSFPISFSAKFFNLPLIIYENNIIMGRANKYLSIFSKKILLAKKVKTNFLKKYEGKTFEVGPILDKEILNYFPIKNQNKKIFSILVLGGSQGAEIFGEIIPRVIKMIKKNGIEVEITQQCLENQKKYLKDFYIENNIKSNVFDFEKNILKLISNSDLAITRCGASATAELVHTITPFIAVPLLDSIDNHQYINAKYYENKGCCWLLEQKDFSEDNLFNLILDIFKNKNKLDVVCKNMKKFYNKNVYSNIEREIEEFI